MPKSRSQYTCSANTANTDILQRAIGNLYANLPRLRERLTARDFLVTRKYAGYGNNDDPEAF